MGQFDKILYPTQSAVLADYKGSGYDRGHLCPAGDMKLDQHAMDETFFMSNLSPQTPAFNRDKWRELEEQVRKWGRQYDMTFIATGPILDTVLGTIGENEIYNQLATIKLFISLQIR